MIFSPVRGALRYTARVACVHTFVIERTWEGEPLASSDRVSLSVELERGHARLDWNAPWPVGPIPAEPPGQYWGLWEFSVVEFFLASAEGPYVEFEFGPAGHWLGLYLASYRKISSRLSDVQYRCWREGERWRGHALVALPESHRWQAANAYFLDGHAGARRYCAASSVPNVAPDFHRRDCYLTL